MRICRLLCEVGNVLSTENKVGGSTLEVDFNNFVKAGSDGDLSDTTSIDTPSESTGSEDDEEKAEDLLVPSLLGPWCVSRRASAGSVDLGGRVEELVSVVEEVNSGAKLEVCASLNHKIREAECRIEESGKDSTKPDFRLRDSPINTDSRARSESAADFEKWDEKGSEYQQKPGPSSADSERRESTPNITLVMPGCSTRYPTKLRMRVPPSSKLPRKP
jgi:hypothetical protein